MSSFSESALEKKLSELSNSQQSVQTLSLWIIHHRKHSALIVKVWHRELKKAKSTRKLTFLYLANDVIQNSKKKGPEFTKDFESVLVDACSHVASSRCSSLLETGSRSPVFLSAGNSREADESCKKHMERLLNIWKERSLYRNDFIQQLKLAIEDSNSPKPAEEKRPVKRTYQKVQEEEEDEDDDYRSHSSPRNSDASATLLKSRNVTSVNARLVCDLLIPRDTTGTREADDLLTEELVKALQDLENAASGDAAVRQKIASLPQEVQDVSLLEKITDKEAADKLSKTVDEACLLLAEYNGRLAAELEDRRQLARMLTEYISSQKEALSEREKKLEEYKQKLARVTQVRKELKSHIQSLPDLSLLPNVTGGLAPLPSAGDLFSTD
ncbi:regulation of nuclear pre-mRNA domain-containing protein 1B isoform X1 [Centroberyx affinis]|uniref:regulation of nuclear pre-mRNA domain-containing protein 1B isoform X1 n=1 Tax=Centroberyx affinis TaxID=166261 RepID=UPI003A5C239C